MNTDLYNDLAEKAKDHATRKGLSEEWAYGFLNVMWPTIEATIPGAGSGRGSDDA